MLLGKEFEFFGADEAEGGFEGEAGFGDVLGGLEAVVFGSVEFDAAGFRLPENPAGAAVVFGAGLADGADRDGAGLVGGNGEDGFAFPVEFRFGMVENFLLVGVAEEADLVRLVGEQFEGGGGAVIAVDVVECLGVIEAAVGDQSALDGFRVGERGEPFGLLGVEGNGGVDEASGKAVLFPVGFRRAAAFAVLLHIDIVVSHDGGGLEFAAEIDAFRWRGSVSDDVAEDGDLFRATRKDFLEDGFEGGEVGVDVG